jgi:hypothetical protein
MVFVEKNVFETAHNNTFRIYSCCYGSIYHSNILFYSQRLYFGYSFGYDWHCYFYNRFFYQALSKTLTRAKQTADPEFKQTD